MMLSTKKQQVQYGSFARDVLKGLSSNPKRVPSKYLYDAAGDALYCEIMHLPEYYPGRCESEILDTFKEEIARICCENEPFKLIDMGAGDASKTEILIRYFIKNNLDFEYIPIDISPNALDFLYSNFLFKYPEMRIHPMQGDYNQILSRLMDIKERKLVLFLGSNLGNCDYRDSIWFLKKIQDNLKKGDYLLLGLDLKKDPATIIRAYSDTQGVTSRFNFNLLKRMNRELGADFNTSLFRHYVNYDPVNGEVKSFLVSRVTQYVRFSGLDKTFRFEQWEPLHTECSNKYDYGMITTLARESGFSIVKSFFDGNNYFTDTLWKK